jgi:gluconolactonase
MTDVAINIEAEGLAHPEGPAFLDDGSMVFVETFRERVSVWRPGRGVASYADVGGGPNACCVGTDGVYLTQIGARVGSWVASRPQTPSIQKIDRTGRVSTVASRLDGRELSAPNDLCFGPSGELIFTDPGDFNPANPSDGFLFAIDPDGTCRWTLNVGRVFPNGLVAMPDGAVIWVESYTRRVCRRALDGTSSELGRLPEGHMPDGLKAGEDGRLYIASIMSGGIDVLDLKTGALDFIQTGGQPLNCAFAGTSLFVADNGVIAHDDPEVNVRHVGRLLRLDLGVSGLTQFTGAIATGVGEGTE